MSNVKPCSYLFPKISNINSFFCSKLTPQMFGNPTIPLYCHFEKSDDGYVWSVPAEPLENGRGQGKYSGWVLSVC